jgi:O-antigen/teichoic acid export membrane protein
VVVNFLSNYSADILLGVFLSPAATGLYRASHRMVTGVSDLITNPMRLSAMTIFSRRAAEGAESGRLWGRVVAASLFVGWTAVAGLAAIAAQAAPLVLGPRWRAAGPIIAILCLQRACAFVDGATTPLLVAYGHARVLLIMQLAMAAGGVGLLALVAHRGVGMVALSSGATALITTISCCIIAIRRFDGMLAGLPKVLPVALGPPLVTGLAAFCASRLVAGLRLGEVSSVAIEVLAGGAAFVIASFFLRNGVMNVLQALNQPARPTEAAVP